MVGHELLHAGVFAERHQHIAKQLFLVGGQGLAREPGAQESGHLTCPGRVVRGHPQGRALQVFVRAFQESRGLAGLQRGSRHLVQGNQRGLAHQWRCVGQRGRHRLRLVEGDERVDDGVPHKAVFGVGGGGQQRGNRLFVAKLPQGRGRLPPHGRVALGNQGFELVHCLGIAGQPRRPGGRHPHLHAGIGQAETHGGQGRDGADLVQREHGFCAGIHRGRLAQHIGQGWHGCFLLIYQPPHCPVADGGAGVGEVGGGFGGCERSPLYLVSVRIGHFSGSCAAHPVNGSLQVGLGHLRQRAAFNEPAARFHHEQAAVGIFQHVGRVEILILGREKNLVFGAERSPVADEFMAQHPVRVELRTEQVVLETGSQGRAPVAANARRGHTRILGNHRHQLAGAHQAVAGNVVVGFGIHAAFRPVHQGIALAGLRVGEVGFGTDGFGSFGKREFDGVIHATRRNPFQARAVRAHAPDARGSAFEPLAFLGRHIKPVDGTGKVEPAVGPQKRADQAVGVHVEGPAGQQHFAIVGHAVAVCVGEFEQVGGGSGVKASLVEHTTLRKANLVGKNGAFVVHAIAVLVFQQVDAELRVVKRILGFLVHVSD